MNFKYTLAIVRWSEVRRRRNSADILQVAFRGKASVVLLKMMYSFPVYSNFQTKKLFD